MFPLSVVALCAAAQIAFFAATNTGGPVCGLCLCLLVWAVLQDAAAIQLQLRDQHEFFLAELTSREPFGLNLDRLPSCRGHTCKLPKHAPPHTHANKCRQSSQWLKVPVLLNAVETGSQPSGRNDDLNDYVLFHHKFSGARVRKILHDGLSHLCLGLAVADNISGTQRFPRGRHQIPGTDPLRFGDPAMPNQSVRELTEHLSLSSRTTLKSCCFPS